MPVSVGNTPGRDSVSRTRLVFVRYEHVRHLIEVSLESLVLRAALCDLDVLFSLLSHDLQLSFALLSVEPDATPGDHRRDYQKLDPVPERYAVAVAEDDCNGHEGNSCTSQHKLPSGTPPARLLLLIHSALSYDPPWI
jgi:hypothetical protein